jgi:hypothetical protein
MMRAILGLGSTGCQPVIRGSLPRTARTRLTFEIALRAKMHSARRPNATGWQPVLPRIGTAQ